MSQGGNILRSVNDQPNLAAPSGARFRLLALAALTVALIVLCVVVAVPFLPAITWAVALAIIAWPLHRWMSRHVAHPGLAAAASTAVVLLVILVPGTFVTYQLAREATDAAERMRRQSVENTLRESMARTPVLRQVVAWMDRMDIDLERELRKLGESYTQDISGLIQGSITAFIQLAVAVFILYHLFRDRAALMQGLRDVLPLSCAECDRVFSRAADSVHANLYATIITSVIDGVSGGLMFWLLGLPSPVMWGVVMFVLSVLPVVGTALVWLPAAAFLAMTNQWLAAVALVGWGIVEFIIVDNIIYVRLAGERMRMHDVPMMVAFLGGIAVFGMSGMILGPAILAVTMALLELWRQPEKGVQIVPANAVTGNASGPAAADEATPSSRPRADTELPQVVPAARK